MALLDNGDVDQAVEAAKGALLLKPDDSSIRDALNRALAAQGGVSRRPHD
jgi:hypothetical protein